ncbi:hypothetical protein JTE90_015945 [Oedothorax gibbosus]|uniref:Uncharacterized protein n=1 Tax=Oedothorax gibbosus TaxID=931172 RepID=A0AAV6TM82_9ARAC|nr:hypothetical protein JTE90_015945 [Oedothorax gibbosus]
MSIRLSMKRLLPHPYETDCRDYELSWKENNKTGPVSREVCEQECTKKYSPYFEKAFAVRSRERERCKKLLEHEATSATPLRNRLQRLRMVMERE